MSGGYERLKEIDPVAANRIHPNDQRKVRTLCFLFPFLNSPFIAWFPYWLPLRKVNLRFLVSSQIFAMSFVKNVKWIQGTEHHIVPTFYKEKICSSSYALYCVFFSYLLLVTGI